jgi:hypothetical protein
MSKYTLAIGVRSVSIYVPDGFTEGPIVYVHLDQDAFNSIADAFENTGEIVAAIDNVDWNHDLLMLI